MRYLGLISFVLVCFTAEVALAAELVFPKGERVGLVPIEGLAAATTFSGFEATDQRVKIVITELSSEAFDSIDAAFESKKVNSWPKPAPFELTSGLKAYIVREAAVGIRRFSLLVSGPMFSGYVVAQFPDNAGTAYSDEAVERMLASTALRPEVPPGEVLERLPFKLNELGAFKSIRRLPTGTSVLLTDAVGQHDINTAPFMMIGLMLNGPVNRDDRGRYAQQIATELPGLRDVRIVSSESLRIDGNIGYETRFVAVTGKDNVAIVAVQWLRFGGANMILRIVAGAQPDDWPEAFARFRAVRDGIGQR